jgi:hypothetical protein
MRRASVLPLCLAAVATVAGCGGGGGDAPTTSSSRFTAPAPTQWRVSTHPLGRGTFKPVNVTFTPGGLLLTLPAGTLDGGELQATAGVEDGTFTARMRTAGSPGSISAFFLLKQDAKTDSSDELDFEIPGGTPHRVLLTVWRKGVKTPAAQRIVPLAFDPAAGFHDYRFVRDGTHVTFTIDGGPRFTYAKAPDVSLLPVFNAWYPTWQTPATPPQGGQVAVRSYTATS